MMNSSIIILVNTNSPFKEGDVLKKFLVLLMVGMLLGAFLLVGCGTDEPVEADDEEEEEVDEEPASEPMSFIAGSASAGGANYLLMSGWAEIINANTDHNITVEATGGPAANVELIGTGSADIGVITMSVGLPAFEDSGWAEGQGYTNFRSLFGAHESYLDGITLKEFAEADGVETIADIPDDWTISIGPAGGTPSIAVPPILEYFGVNPDTVNLGMGDSTDAIGDRQIHGAMFLGGAPRPAYVELDASHGAAQIGLTEEQVEELVEALPMFYAGYLTADTYAYLDEDAYTLKDRNGYVIREDVPRDVVYELVSVTIENLETWKEVHDAIGFLEVGDVLLDGVAIPLHPGAVDAFEDAGITVPDHLIPPEM